MDYLLCNRDAATAINHNKQFFNIHVHRVRRWLQLSKVRHNNLMLGWWSQIDVVCYRSSIHCNMGTSFPDCYFLETLQNKRIVQ